MQTVTAPLVQTSADGRTRTFRFGATRDGMFMSIEIKGADGQLRDAADYHFTDAEFDQFRELVKRA
jgi:hypothetical protein